jgi:ribonuclease HI
MKTLKLNHDLAGLVLKGKKTSTWRLYDDKDLSVSDDVQLIDKVNPDDPESWRPIGVAHIDSIVQKRLGDLQAADYEGHELFTSKAKMMETYRHYYGPQVDELTAVKIIRFTFHSAQTVVHKSPNITEVKLYTDGGSRGNPGPSASGYAILDMNGHIVVKKGVYLGITTNNQAEYQALKFGLEEVQKMGVKEVDVFMDSLLVINQMLGIFKIKNRDLWPIYAAIKDLAASFKRITFTHVPRELNKIADSAVNETLDDAASRHP